MLAVGVVALVNPLQLASVVVQPVQPVRLAFARPESVVVAVAVAVAAAAASTVAEMEDGHHAVVVAVPVLSFVPFAAVVLQLISAVVESGPQFVAVAVVALFLPWPPVVVAKSLAPAHKPHPFVSNLPC